MSAYCKEYPERCKLMILQEDPSLYSSTYPIITTTESKTKRKLQQDKGFVFNTDYIIETNRKVGRPDWVSQRGINELKNRIPTSLEIGSQKVIHSKKAVLNSYLSQVAYEYAYKGLTEAEKYLQEGSKLVPELADLRIVRVPRFTNNNHITFHNPKTNEVYLSFRGSDGAFLSPEANVESLLRGQGNRLKNAVDWGTNLYTLQGQEHTTKRYKKAVKVAQQVAEYFKVPVEELNLSGHSLGGGQADHVAEVLGSKSVSFDPARNPFAKRPVNPKSSIESHSTIFDPVSIGRHLHEGLKGRPSHIKHTTYTSAIGQEAGWVNQHDLEGQFIKPLQVKDGVIFSMRSSPLRNALGLVGGQAENTARGIVGGLGNIVMPYALTPQYDTKGEQAFRTAQNYSDAIKMTTGMSNMLYKVNPAFYFIDTPALVSDLLSIDPIVPREAKVWFKSKLGIKEPAPKYQAPPKLIEFINKKLDPITGRYTADQQLKFDMEQSEALGLSLDNYLQITHGKGADPHSVIFDTPPVSTGGSALLYTTDEAHKIAQKYHRD